MAEILEENAVPSGVNPARAEPPPARPADGLRLAPVAAEPLERILGYLLEYFPMFMVHFIPVFGGILTTVYVLIRDGIWPGQSVGKKVMKTQVLVLATGLPATYRESVIRNFPLAIGFFISIVPLIGHIIGFIVGIVVLLTELALLFIDPERRRIGDKLAGTIVVKSPV